MADTKTPMSKALESVDWIAVEGASNDADDLPFATHTGVLKFGDTTLDVVRLNTGERLITEESLMRAFGVSDELLRCPAASAPLGEAACICLDRRHA